MSEIGSSKHYYVAVTDGTVRKVMDPKEASSATHVRAFAQKMLHEIDRSQVELLKNASLADKQFSYPPKSLSELIQTIISIVRSLLGPTDSVLMHEVHTMATNRLISDKLIVGGYLIEYRPLVNKSSEPLAVLDNLRMRGKEGIEAAARLEKRCAAHIKKARGATFETLKGKPSITKDEMRQALCNKLYEMTHSWTKSAIIAKAFSELPAPVTAATLKEAYKRHGKEKHAMNSEQVMNFALLHPNAAVGPKFIHWIGKAEHKDLDKIIDELLKYLYG